MESYAPQNEKSGCRLTFFVLRSIRFSRPTRSNSRTEVWKQGAPTL